MTRNRTFLHPFFFSLFVVFVTGFFSVSVFAQTGKISGKIIDAKTGEALFKASIQILETKQGALSKDNGIATIINVAPSENYTIVAKYAGYEPFTIKGVKVQSDQTVKLEFKLSSKHQDTIVVAADKLVDVTKIGIGDKLSNSEIIAIAGTQNINQVVAITPGIVRDATNGGFSVHGSRGTDNSERINGIETTNIVSGGESITQTAVSKFAISEINIATGGLDASRGNTTGAQIDATTRNGGSNFEFQFRYRTDLPALFGTSGNGYKQMGSNDKTYELAVGGPITEDIKYFITAKGNTQQYEDELADLTSFGSNQDVGLNVIDPAGNNLGQLPNAHYYSRGGTVNLSFDLLGFHMAADAVLSSINRQFTSWAFIYGDPAEIPANNSIDNLYTLTANTGIGSTGILKLTAGYETQSSRIGKYDQSQNGGLFSMYKIYDASDKYTYDDNTHTVTPGADGIIDIYTPVSKQIADPHNPSTILNLSGAGINPFTGHIEGGGITTSTNNAYGLYNTFFAAGNVFGFTNHSYNQIQFKADYNDQIGAHGIAGGFETEVYTINRNDNGLPWDANPFRDSFSVKPVIGSIYLQDKMEFSDITFQPGLRFDIYNPGNDHVVVDPYNPLRQDTSIVGGKQVIRPVGNFSKAPVQTQLSPRLGITYSISDKTLFNFNYDIYFKRPLFLDVLTNTGGNFNTVLQRGNNIIGNGGLKGESDEEINVGFSTGITDAMKVTVNGIFKKMRNIAGLARITSSGLALGYQLYTDDQYGSYKGIELTFEKRMTDNFSFKLNYTYSTTQGTSSSATENYIALINQSSSTENAVLPLQPFPLDFDRTHVAQFLFNVLFSKGEGPKIGGVPFLERFSLNTTTTFQTGTPYTAFDIKGTQVGDHNAQREPSFMQTDATLTRNIPFAELFGSGVGTSSLDIQLEVLNLFNRNQAISVYHTTGQGDDDGANPNYTGSTDFINDPTNADGTQLDGLGMLKYNPSWDLNKDGRVSVDEQTQAFKRLRADGFARRTNYQIPRRFYLNFTLHF